MTAVDAEVIVIGSGPVGGSLAGLLACQGVECIVLDPRRDIDRALVQNDPRALAITPASVRVMQAFELWQHIPRDKIGCFRRIRVWDENGDGDISFDCAELCEPALGYIVQQSMIQTTLDQLLGSLPTVSLQRGISVVGLLPDESTHTVALEDGRRFTAKLVVAADGIHSKARDLAGIAYHIHDYRQQAIACVVQTGLSHEEIARQRFLTDGPLAFLPMAEVNQCGIVWSTAPERAHKLMAMQEQEFNETLQSAFDYTLGEVIASGPRAGFPLKRAQAASYCSERFVLIGDAAHCVHPLAGQGANLGLLDAACLVQILVTARMKGKDYGNRNILRRYERWRKGENYMMMMVFEGFKYLFENQIAPLPLFRNTGMKLFNGTEPLKHIVMKRAMGLAGDLPDIVKAF